MKALVITPAYSHAHHALQAAVQRAGLPWLPVYEHSDLPRVRSVLIEQGLSSGAERLIFADADTIPADGVLEALAATPVITPARALWGMYPLREGDRWSVHPRDEREAAAAIERGHQFRIEWGGLGLAAVHRDSLARLGDSLPFIDDSVRWRPFCVPFVRGTTYCADDRSLCVRLLESGTELWCDPRVRAGHAVSRIITELRAP